MPSSMPMGCGASALWGVPPRASQACRSGAVCRSAPASSLAEQNTAVQTNECTAKRQMCGPPSRSRPSRSARPPCITVVVCTLASRELNLPGERAQVNIAGRAAAVSPANADTLAAFAGVYASHQLPEVAGKPAEAGFELSITVNAQGTPQPQPARRLPQCLATDDGGHGGTLVDWRCSATGGRSADALGAQACMHGCTAVVHPLDGCV